jgi:hypothetical protein
MNTKPKTARGRHTSSFANYKREEKKKKKSIKRDRRHHILLLESSPLADWLTLLYAASWLE